MTKAAGKSGKAGRTISDDEAQLWRHATRDLEPVRMKPRVGAAEPASKAQPAAASKASPPAPRDRRAPAAHAPAKPKHPVGIAATPPRKRSAPPLADFDRRRARQIAAGSIAIDDEIDLHGLRRRDARARLLAFLLQARASGCKTVLVITGKGGDQEPPDRLGGLLGEPQRGVLKHAVPQWLEEPDMRALVLSFTWAHNRHGGSGALYLHLRRSGTRG